MSSDAAVKICGVGKVFPIYAKPHHRLLEMLSPRGMERFRSDFHALKGIDLEIRKGHTVGIVGRNGSGKSTLLQIICGTLAPTTGSVEVVGRLAALLELGAGFNPEFTGLENVYLNATILGLGRSEIEQRLDDILSFADIGNFINQPVKNYSSGMYVRLAFAVAINVTPEVLVVDEALSVGDEAFQRKCFSRIEKIREAGATVLFVSHSAGTVVDLCDQAILLDGGELLMQGAPKRVVSLYQKLIYAPTEQQLEIREAIRSDTESVIAAQTTESTAVPEKAVKESTKLEAWYDPHLLPASVIAYQDRGATIEDAHLSTLNGRRVNMLVHGEEYLYTYKVKTRRTLSRVRCGMMIRTTTGIEVGGAATDPAMPQMQLVSADATIEVCFRIRCLLNPGTYFLNAGCLADTGAMEEYIDRRVDVAMFRVMPDHAIRATALVDLVIDDSIEWRT
ncbi:MAG: ABC transporter ATP-binding protein [Thermomonas sp.]|uniref:ABC transporter ATP-binding protein n=1 Tax=Thermomonas sp. TaxID=1971895 RepID=UPI001ED4DE2F|nr:ABC transporter ATP-binding protein [Thermomonas sp.]MBV2208673.1 ABC transporter ATP-binding protein [Thermomonas sp.]